MDDHDSPGSQVRAGFAQVIRWSSRAEVRKYLLGPASAGLSATDAALLEYLTKKGPMRGSALAAQHGVDKSTMTLQLRRLEDRGLIDRQPDPNDRRATLLATSQAGLELQQRISRAGSDAFDEILSTWSEQDRQALGAMLVRFAAQLDQHPLAKYPDRRIPGTG